MVNLFLKWVIHVEQLFQPSHRKTAYPRGEYLLILGAIAINTAKSSKENVTDNRRLENMILLADT